MKKELPYCNTWLVFWTECKISNFITFKDRIPLFLRSGIVYKFQCGSSKTSYYGKTEHHFKVKMCQDVGISVLAGERFNSDDSAIKNIF